MSQFITLHILRSMSNSTVTSNNFDIIHKAGLLSGLKVNDFCTIRNAIKYGGKNDIYVSSSIIDILKLHFSNRRRIVFWVQGIIPEESFIRNNSKIRKYILSLIEKAALKKAFICSFVSKSMEDHFRTKYSFKPKIQPYIFPCYNTEINKDAFHKPLKYENNCFVYAGGLAKWQCFEETLKVYKYFEDLNISNTKLIILTKDTISAQKMVQKVGIKNYTIDYVSKNDLPRILSEAKFGFVIREKHIVNQVSTPTKISTYLSCGIIPIYGGSILSFDQLAKNMKFAIKWEGQTENYRDVEEKMNLHFNAEEVYKEYYKIFNTYFSTELHTKNISNVFLKIINS